MAAAPSAKLQDPRPSIFVEGQESASLALGLLGLSIEEDTRGLYRCNWSAGPPANGFIFFDRKTLDFGKKLEVKLSTDSIFEGIISALEASFLEGQPPSFAVLLEDRLQKLRMTRRTRSFTDVSDSDLFQKNRCRTQPHSQAGHQRTYIQIGCASQPKRPGVSSRTCARRRCRTLGDRNGIACAKRANRNGGSAKLGLGNELYEFTVLADLTGQRTSVTVNGWDVSAKSAISHEAGKQAIQGELGGDDSAAAILSSALGDRKEAVNHTVPLNSSEAKSLAESYYRSIARQFVTGRGRAQTSSQLRVGSFVELSGIGPIFSGKYYITYVKHSFKGAVGIHTEFSAERPGIGKAQ